MKNAIYKKYTQEYSFERKYYCCFLNHREVWKFWKRYNRRRFRRIMKSGEFD